MSQRQHFTALLSILWLLHSFYSSLSISGRRGGPMKTSPSELSTQSLILGQMTQDVSLPWWLPSARSFSLNSVLFWALSPRPCVCVCLLHRWAASPVCAFILGWFLCLLPPLSAQLLSPSWAEVSVFLWWFFLLCYHHLLLRGIQIAPGRLFDIVLTTLRPHSFLSAFPFFFYFFTDWIDFYRSVSQSTGFFFCCLQFAQRSMQQVFISSFKILSPFSAGSLSFSLLRFNFTSMILMYFPLFLWICLSDKL